MRGGTRWRAVSYLGLSLVTSELAVVGHAHAEALPRAADGVRLEGRAGAAVRRAVKGAQRSLLEPACRALMDEFTNASGQPLQSGLDALELTASQFVGFVVFVDGSGRKRCRNREVFAGLANPGSRVVEVCGDFFTWMESRYPHLAEAVVIHEALHSLGLGENPPSSTYITKRILLACSNRRDAASPPTPVP